jgi:hypothetical protein
MPHEERNAWGAIIASVITFTYFGGRIWAATTSCGYGGADGLRLRAWNVIWLMLGGVSRSRLLS